MRKDSFVSLLIVSCGLPLSEAWTTIATSSMQRHPSTSLRSSSSSSTSSTGDEFAAFAASLEEDDVDNETKKGPRKAVSNYPYSSSDTATAKTIRKSWQDDLDKLLDPTTPFNKRQVLLQDLLSANGEIRTAVEAALRDRKVRCYLFDFPLNLWTILIGLRVGVVL